TGTAMGTILDDDMNLETFEGEMAPGMAFSENGNNFTTTSPMEVAQSTNLGCCPSTYFLQGFPTGNVGSINFTNTGIGGFVLQEFDAWTSANGGSNNASGMVT